jgi:23S rRNA (adenine2030-N6)-methyltransferase
LTSFLEAGGLFVNYQHDFHAGNFADVLKHVGLCRILRYLRDSGVSRDRHACGSGLYDLGGEKALRGGEWQDGIGKLMAAKIPEATAALLWPYLEVVRALNERNRLRVYPGSRALARAWLRAQDRLIASSLSPRLRRR